MTRLRNERGIALAVAIFALVVIGGLVAGSLFVATQEQRVGRNTLRQEVAFTAAEGTTQNTILNWNPNTYNSMTVGGTLTSTGTTTGGGWYRQTVQKLNRVLYVVRTEGFSQDSTSRQRVGSLLRLRIFEFDINAALKTQGTTQIGGSSYIDGHDNLPSTWTGCPATQPTMPGIRTPDPTQVSYSGCTNQNCISGDPKILKDTTITTQSLTTVGEIPFDSLKQFATKILAGGTMQIQPTLTVDGTCNYANPYNWGNGLAPTLPCGNYYPIVWVEGDASINGFQGQGVLIVNGNLNVQGGFEFFGPVLVRQTVNTQGTGGHFTGGVIAANVNLSQNVVLGNAVVSFSSCALIRALTNSAAATAMRERSWVNLY